MESIAAAQHFAVLGHPGRLDVFRLLVRMAPHPMRPTQIAATLAIRPNTLSNYLSELSSAGLIQVTRHGRALDYSVNPTQVAALTGFLLNDCCRGRPDLCGGGATLPAALSNRPHVLFLCSANSARSLMAEALLRDLGRGRFTVCSAGTRPGAGPHPLALEVLHRHGHATDDLRSKRPDQAEGVRPPDFVFTLCDGAAAEDCGTWPGQPIGGHWSLPDPAAATGSSQQQALAFDRCYATLRRRIEALVALPMAQLDRLSLQQRIDRISLDPDPEPLMPEAHP